MKRRSDQLDRTLREGSPRASDAFVAALSAEIAARPRRSRTAFASAIAVLVLGSFASFGGVGYAAEGAANAAGAAKKAISKTSASDQYASAKPVKTEPPVVAVAGASTPAPAKSTLPFTGLSLVGTVGLGVALLVVGFALRRRENGA